MTSVQRYALLLGRFTLSLIFVLSGITKLSHFSATVGMLAAKGVPAASLMLGMAIVVEIAGGLSLLLGYYAHFGAALLALYLIPVTLVMHDFWAHTGAAAQTQTINFLKNVSIFGGLLYAFVFGAGRVSVDSRAGREAKQTRLIARHV